MTMSPGVKTPVKEARTRNDALNIIAQSSGILQTGNSEDDGFESYRNDTVLNSFANESFVFDPIKETLNTDIMQSWIERKQRKLLKECEQRELKTKKII